MLPWIYQLHCQLKKKTTFLFLLGVVFVFVCIFFIDVSIVRAQADTLGIEQIDQNSVLASEDIRIIIVRIINTLLGLLGIVTVVLMVYAGYIIMTAAGSEERIAQGRKIMINAVIGLIIIMSAWAITKFIINALSGAAKGNPNGENPIALSSFGGSGGLGKTVRDHYPFVDQRDVARNTSIVITFAEPIDPASLVQNTNNTCRNESGEIAQCDETHTIEHYGDCFDGDDEGTDIDIKNECDQLITSTMAVFELSEDMIEISSLEALQATDENAYISAAALLKYEQAPGINGGVADNVYTVVLKPHNAYNEERPTNFLGNQNEAVWHGVYVSPNLRKKGSDQSLFAGQYSNHYYWKFEVSTELDLDPPTVISYLPQTVLGQGPASVKKNNIIEVTFSEAVDPIVTTGKLENGGAFDHALVNLNGELVEGTWRISNGYRTVEFISATPCGENSCGDVMYCMPVTCQNCTQPVDVLLRTGESSNNVDAPFEVYFDSGIYDLAQNGLSSNDDNILTTPERNQQYLIDQNEKTADNHYWQYSVNDLVDRTSPYVARVVPGVDEEDVGETQEVAFQFSELMRTFSFGGNITIEEYPGHVCTNAATSDDLSICPAPYAPLDDFGYAIQAEIQDNKTIAHIAPYRAYGPYDIDLYYYPGVTDDVMDMTQNCVYPGFGPDGSTDGGIDGDTCSVTFDQNGVGTSGDGCIAEVNYSPDTDSGCGYNIPGQEIFSTSSLPACLDVLKKNSPTNYQ